MKHTLTLITTLLLAPLHAAETNAHANSELNEKCVWLEKEAHRIIRASKRTMKDGTAAFPPQVGSGYNAFWLRDYEYTLEGSIASYSDQELTDACVCSSEICGLTVPESIAIRHLPGGVYWEQGCKPDTYQNGAFW